jgi:nitroreductase
MFKRPVAHPVERRPAGWRYPGAQSGFSRPGGKEQSLASVQKTDGQSETLILTHPQGYPRFSRGARHKLTDEETAQLLSLTALSLWAFQVNHCRFVVMRDPELRKQLHHCFTESNPLPPASSIIILCADLRRLEKTSTEKGEAGPEPTATVKIAGRSASGESSLQRARDEAMSACGVAAQTLLLTAKAMGFDCWLVNGFDPGGVGALINLPPDFAVAMLLVAGKNIKPAWPGHTAAPDRDVVIIDQF